MKHKAKKDTLFAPVANHKIITRRDFLAQGYMGAVGTVLMPNLLTILASNVAQAACPSASAGAAAGKPGVLVFDLAGGSNIAGSNVMVGKAGGQMDFLAANSYSSVGLPPDQHPSLANMLTTINGKAAGQGLAFHANSDLLRGIVSTAGAGNLANVDGMVFAAASGDDTSNNPHNPAYWIYKAGARGNLVNIIGSNNNDSGGNAVAPAPSVDPSVRSVQITNATQAAGLVQLGSMGAIFASNASDKVKKILAAAEMTSGRKLASFNAMDMSDQIKELVSCGFIDSKDLVGRFTPAAVDPTQDAMVNAAFVNQAADGDRRKAAAIAKLVIDGYAGVGTVSMGGYDYHGQGRVTQANKDFAAGALIGSSINLAAAKGKDLMVILYTDGGVSSGTAVNNDPVAKGRYDFESDNGSRSAAMVLVYKAGGAPTMIDATRQAGAFKDDGSIDRQAGQLSDNVLNLSKAFVANYLALTGEEGKLAQVVGTETLSTEFAKYVKFAKLR